MALKYDAIIISAGQGDGSLALPKAIWNGAVLAESDETVVAEGNHYFPPESINRDFFQANETHAVCPWKGAASYFDTETEQKKLRPGLFG